VDPTTTSPAYTGLNIKTQYKYDNKGNLTRVIDANNNSTWFIYDNAGQKTHQIVTTGTYMASAVGAVTTFEYDKNGKLYHTRQYATTLGTNVLNNLGDAPISVTLPAADNTNDRRTYSVYSDDGDLRYTLKAINANEWAVNETIYDANNNVVQTIAYDKTVSDSNVSSITATNSTGGALITTAEVAAQITALGYSSSSLGQARITRNIYDANNRLRFTLDPMGNMTEKVYDAGGRIIKTIQHDKPVQSYYQMASGSITLPATNYTVANPGIVHMSSVKTAAGSAPNFPQAWGPTRTVGTDFKYSFTTDASTNSHYATIGINSSDWKRRHAINQNGGTFYVEYVDKDGLVKSKALGPIKDSTSYMLEIETDAAGTTLYLYEYGGGSGSKLLGYIDRRDYSDWTDVKTWALVGNSPALNGNSTTTFGTVTEYSSGVNRTTSYTYDKANRLRFTVNAEGGVTENIYDAIGHVKTITQFETPIAVPTDFSESIIDGLVNRSSTEDNRSTSYEYDKAGRQNKTILAGWYDYIEGVVYAAKEGDARRFQRTIDVTYDAMGNAVVNKIRTGSTSYVYQYKTYDKAGREVHDIDGLGYVTKKTYDATGNVASVKRFNGDPITLTSGTYWIASDVDALIQNYASRTMEYGYDRLGRITHVIQPASVKYFEGAFRTEAAATTYTYNTFGDVTHQFDRIGSSLSSKASTYFYYDKLGRKTFTVDAENYGTKTEYNAFGDTFRTTEYAKKYSGAVSAGTPPTFSDTLTTAEIESLGDNRVTEYSLDALGKATQIRRKINGVLTTVGYRYYNAFGEVYSSSNNGVSASMEFNRLGNVTKVTESSRTVANTTGNVFLNQIKNVSPITTIAYNAFGESTSETRSASTAASIASTTTIHQYDAAGNEIATRDALGNWSVSNYDVSGKVIRQWQTVSAGGPSETTYSYNIDRRFEYDKAGRQTATKDLYTEAGVVKQSGQVNVYNAYGEVVEERRVWGTGISTAAMMNRPTNNALVNTYTYDDAGQLSSKRNADGYTSYFYDWAGRLTYTRQQAGSASDPATDRVTKNIYDKLGRITQQDLPRFAATMGNQTSITDPTYSPTLAGPIIYRTYDRWGNKLTEGGASVNNGQTYAYNHDNLLTKRTYAARDVLQLSATGDYKATQIIETTQYNRLGQITAFIESAKDVSTGATIQRTSVTNVYNNVGQLTKTFDATGVTTSYAYDAYGRRVGTEDASGVVTVDTYDANDQLIKHSLLSADLSTYYYDQAGRRYGEYDGVATQYYKYDERGNLLVNRNREGASHVYTYDELNNKTSETLLPSTGGSISLNTWSYRDQANTTDYVDYMSDRLQSRVIGSGTAQSYSYFYENGFGQLTREENVNGASKGQVIYSYWTNGLQKSVVESSSVTTPNGEVVSTIEYGGYDLVSTITSSQYTTTTGLKSYFYYDIYGNKTAERNETIKDIGAYTLTRTDKTKSTGNINSITTTQVAAQSSSPGGFIYYKYDALGRLSEVVSPRPSSEYVDLTSLKYDYDEWGNRRRIFVSSTQGTRSEWFSYDDANRVLVENGVFVGNQLAANKRQGIVYTYENGKRKSQEKYQGHAMWTYNRSPGNAGDLGDDYMYTTFTYNDLGLLEETHDSIKRRQYSTGYTITTLDPEISSTQTEYYYGMADKGYSTTRYALGTTVRYYDNRGFLTDQESWIDMESVYSTRDSDAGRTIVNTYTNDGTLKTQTVNGETDSLLTNYYLPSGEIQKYTFESGGVTHTYNYTYITTYSGRQVSAINVNSSQGGTATGTTYNKYDMRGRLTSSSISASYTPSMSTVVSNGYSYSTFSYNNAGQILHKTERLYRENSTTKTQSYYYAPNGGELANLGGIGGIDISPLTNVYTIGETPTSYTVNEGDTLMGIAQTLFGDAKLWYLIADLNGLAMGPTDAFIRGDEGRSLRIPNSDRNISNTSTNFKPYNPTEVIGDLTPSPYILPPPPPPKAKGCSGIASAIMIAVAVVATIYTAGAAGAYFGAAGAAGGGFAGGMAVLGGSAGFGAAALGAAAVGGFVGSAASQLVGKAMGAVDHFSLRQAVGSGLTAGFAAGAGAALQGAGAGWAVKSAATATKAVEYYSAGYMALGAASYLGSYASNKIVGLETHFNWTDMAVASISAGITSKTGSSVGNAIGGLGGAIGANFASNMWGATVNSSLSRLAGRGNTLHGDDWGMMAADAFGNALGSKIVDALKPKGGINNIATSVDVSRLGQMANAGMDYNLDIDLEFGGSSPAQLTQPGSSAAVAAETALSVRDSVSEPIALTTSNEDRIIGADGIEEIIITGSGRRAGWFERNVIDPVDHVFDTLFSNPTKAAGAAVGWAADGLSSTLGMLASMNGSPYDYRPVDTQRGALVSSSVNKQLYGMMPQGGDFYAGANDPLLKQGFDVASIGLGGASLAKTGLAHLGRSGATNSLKFNSKADPLLDSMGPAQLSHPQEYRAIMGDLEANNVAIKYGDGSIAFSPNTSGGLLGNEILLPNEFSISALRHEYGHFLDHKALGSPRYIEYFQKPELIIQTERRQYLNEINTAKSINDQGARRTLIENYLNEKSTIVDRYYQRPYGSKPNTTGGN